jgi:hypothetical protein
LGGPGIKVACFKAREWKERKRNKEKCVCVCVREREKERGKVTIKTRTEKRKGKIAKTEARKIRDTHEEWNRKRERDMKRGKVRRKR